MAPRHSRLVGRPRQPVAYLPNSDLRTYRPAAVEAVPTGCLAYCTLRIALGVARRLIEPAVLRTGCIARLMGLGRKPLLKLTMLPRA